MTGRPTDIIAAMLDLLALFAVRCEDKHTLRKLIALAEDRSRWTEARSLFSEVRQKTLAAERRKDELALAQYAFEEICAKTLYNLTRGAAPYDPDSPFWILPLAVELARQLGVTDPGEISPLLRTG
jgi:hypothetical protein